LLILGGSGFIGRHAVAAAIERGHEIVIGSRSPQRVDRKLLPNSRGSRAIVVHMERLIDAASWLPLIDPVEAVVNCVGILRQRGAETYDAVHHRAVAALAAACAQLSRRLVHVSALGLDAPARSRFLTSKRHGERALMASAGDWRLVRPSLLDGEGGYGASWLRRVAHWPVHPVPASAQGRIAALDVRDLAECLSTLATDRATVSADRRVFEFGGETALRLADYLQALRGARPAARRVSVPSWIARGLSHLCDGLHLTPFSFGHFELLQRDNLPAPNRLPEVLGRTPRTVWPGDH
jgi:NADH dehydrogenase